MWVEVMSKYVLSVIIPVYNVEKYLQECIDSIINQLTEECEVIMVDDGSTDSSGRMCDVICDSNPNFTVIHKENGGLSDARNAGIISATGTYVMFLDSDDKLAPNSISTIINNIKHFKTDLLLGRTEVFSQDKIAIKKNNIDSYDNYQNIKDPSKILEELDKNNSFWFAAWLVIVRREFLLENALFFEKGILHEDERWVPLVFANAKTAKMFDDAFYMYRTNREGSIVSSPRIKREFDKISTAEYLYQYSTNKKSATRLLKRRAASLIFG